MFIWSYYIQIVKGPIFMRFQMTTHMNKIHPFNHIILTSKTHEAKTITNTHTHKFKERERESYRLVATIFADAIAELDVAASVEAAFGSAHDNLTVRYAFLEWLFQSGSQVLLSYILQHFLHHLLSSKRHFSLSLSFLWLGFWWRKLMKGAWILGFLLYMYGNWIQVKAIWEKKRKERSLIFYTSHRHTVLSHCFGGEGLAGFWTLLCSEDLYGLVQMGALGLS